jgi:hypothetical protein
VIKSSFFLLFFLASSVEFAQMPVGASSDRGSVEGVVVSATGETIEKATVSLCAVQTLEGCTEVTTDRAGQFAFSHIPGGRYHLAASRAGYLDQHSDQNTLNASGAVVDLHGEAVDNVSIRMTPAAVISGYVNDEDRRPMAGVLVAELHYAYVRGERQLQAGAVTRTNDLGEFRLWGLGPGAHYVLAEYVPPPQTRIRNPVGYRPTFYPGVLEPKDATPIQLRAGEETNGIMIELASYHTVRVRGRVSPDDPAAKVFLVRRDTAAVDSLVQPVSTRLRHGEYEFSSVVPGSYYVYAKTDWGDWGERKGLVVADNDIENCDLSLNRLDPIAGTLTLGTLNFRTSNPDFLRRLRPPETVLEVTLSPRVTLLGPGRSVSAWVDSLGQFSLTGIDPGEYVIDVNGLPENCLLESASFLESKGIARNELPGRIWNTDLYWYPSRLDLRVSCSGATVEGVVNKDQQPYSGAAVTLVPTRSRFGSHAVFKATTSDQNGHYVIDGIPSGSYTVFAWESLDSGVSTLMDILTSGQASRAFDLAPSAHETRNLDLIRSNEP